MDAADPIVGLILIQSFFFFLPSSLPRVLDNAERNVLILGKIASFARGGSSSF